MLANPIPEYFWTLKPTDGWKPYCIRFTVGRRPVAWVRYGSSMESALASAKAAIEDEFYGQKVGGITIDSQQS